MLILLLLVAVPVLGAFLLAVGKLRSVDRLKGSVENDVRLRLESIVHEVGGNVVDGPALETLKGRMTLVATRAPQSMVIDLAKFVAPVSAPLLLTVVAVQDAAKVTATKNLRPVIPDDPAIAATYKVLSSDEGWARSVVIPPFVEKLKALEAVVRARPRVQMAGQKIVISAARGLAKPGELKGFHDSCAAIAEDLQARAGA